MAENEQQNNGALGWLKANGILVGVFAIILIPLLIFLGPQLFGGNDDQGPSSQPQATATLDPNQIEHESATPSATPSKSASPTPSVAPVAEPTESYNPDAPLQLADGEAKHGVEIELDPTSTIKNFANAWASPGDDKMEWLTSMRPYVTDELYDGFTDTGLQFVPTDSFLEADYTEEFDRGYSKFNAEFKDGGRLLDGILELQPDGTWLVAKVVPGGDLDLN